LYVAVFQRHCQARHLIPLFANHIAIHGTPEQNFQLAIFVAVATELAKLLVGQILDARH
jgi:hypothetical protein